MNQIVHDQSPVIEAISLSKQFKRNEAVVGLNLAVAPGSICALLGPNGAGKSTTLKLLLGALRPSSGESRVFGEDSAKLGPESFQKIGYVSESQKLPEKMTFGQLLRFLKPNYPDWDDAAVEALLARFELPLDRRLKSFSRGMLMRAKLVMALAYHPDLLLLDEPFAGLDPAACESSVDTILDWSQGGGGKRSALISSHEIEDVERLADRIAIIGQGQLLYDEDVDDLKDRMRRVTISFAEQLALPASLPEQWIGVQQSGRVVTLIDTKYKSEESGSLLRSHFDRVERMGVESMSLRAIYIALANANSSAA